MKLHQKPSRTGSCLAAAMAFAGIATIGQAATSFFSFEDGTTQGWAVNAADWAGGFNALSVADENATDGAKSLKIEFTGKSFKWGAVRENLATPAFLDAIKYGGKLIVDAFVPDTAAGISHIGFVIQQPDVTGDANWQQVWFWIGSQTGSFAIELPFERKGSGAVNLHLGQNATVDQPFTIFVDNVRVESNPPPTNEPEPILVQSFEDGTTQGWAVNAAESANGFQTVENDPSHATQGTKSLKITFSGQSYRWGAVNTTTSDPAFVDAIKYGGKLRFDLNIPDESADIQNLGFAFQQPDVTGALNWQQVWFGTSGQAGSFTIELPFSRNGTAPVVLHLGQNSTVRDEFYTVYLDNLRVVPNPPPPQGVTVTETTHWFSFEDGTTQGFTINNQGWGLAFTSVDAVDGNASEGTKSLQTVFPAGDYRWGAYNLNITDPAILSSISSGGTLYVNATVPEGVNTIQHLGLVLKQPGAAGGKDWQQTWFFVGGTPGNYTIDLPITRENEAAVEIHLGRNSTGEADATAYFDDFRFVTSELVGAAPASIKASREPDGKVKIEFTGSLQGATSAAGPYLPIDSASPYHPDVANTSMNFYRAAAKPIIYFTDDLEGADKGWTTKALAGDSGSTHWELGTPAFPDEITFAHNGQKAWSTGLAANYGDNSAIALLSPKLDLTASPGARLSFHSLLDVGGTDGDNDKVEVFVRDENGGVLTGAENAVWSKTRVASPPWFYAHEIVDLPSAAAGKQVQLEFRVTTDANPSGQRGWFIDDIRVYAKP